MRGHASSNLHQKPWGAIASEKEVANSLFCYRDPYRSCNTNRICQFF